MIQLNKLSAYVCRRFFISERGDIIRKLTYTNIVNGLSAEFSSENPLMHLNLKEFDGSSAGAAAVTYKPVEFDGQKTISANLAARTVVVPVEFSAKSGGRYSRSSALAVWEHLMRVFVPLHEGWLVWADGKSSRRIKCRTAETPEADPDPAVSVFGFLFACRRLPILGGLRGAEH